MKNLFLIILLLLAAGCKQNKERPEGILSKTEMASVLEDIYILEAAVKETRLPYDSAKKVYNYFEAETFKKHGFTDSVYHSSFMYYVDRPQEMEEIYEMVVDSLALKEKLAR